MINNTIVIVLQLLRITIQWSYSKLISIHNWVKKSLQKRQKLCHHISILFFGIKIEHDKQSGDGQAFDCNALCTVLNTPGSPNDEKVLTSDSFLPTVTAAAARVSSSSRLLDQQHNAKHHSFSYQHAPSTHSHICIHIVNI